MLIPEYLRLAFFACVSYYVWTKEGRAWATGGKEDIDLDYENVMELVQMGLFREREAKTGPNAGNTRITTLYTEDQIRDAWAATFTDNPLPEHPGFYQRGDWDMTKTTSYVPAPEGSVEGENRVFFSDHQECLVIPVDEPVPCLRNEHAETLALWRADPDFEGMWPRYRAGVRELGGGFVTANASMLATLRCAIEDELYSCGHLYCRMIEDKFKGTGRYGPVLDSGALYVMLRFGIMEVTQEYIKGQQSEGYGVTPLGLEFYERLNAVKDRLGNQKRYDEIARAMGW